MSTMVDDLVFNEGGDVGFFKTTEDLKKGVGFKKWIYTRKACKYYIAIKLYADRSESQMLLFHFDRQGALDCKDLLSWLEKDAETRLWVERVKNNESEWKERVAKLTEEFDERLEIKYN